MAQVAIKSTAVTNNNATPRTINASGLDGGTVVRAVNGLVTLTSGNTEAATLAAGASTYRVGKIKSSDFIDRVRIDTTADMGTTTVVDVGLYNTLAHSSGGTVVDQDFFASSLSLKDGALSNTDITFEAGAAGGLITNAEKRVWECLGLTTDPGLEYDVALTLTGACDGTGTALVRVYVVR